jgi:hypothetical protein
MEPPLVLDRNDPKWKLLEEILKIFDSRRVKQEMVKEGIKPLARAGAMLRISLIAMFFSLEIAYVLRELETRKELRRFAGVIDVPSAKQVYRFLSRFSEEQFVEVVIKIVNTICSKRGKGKTTIIVDSTDVSIDINWFRRKIKKQDLDEREFKWGYSPSKKYYVGYKLTLAVESPRLRPLVILLHQGSPSDVRIYDEILEELRRRRIARNGDVAVFDKGYYSYKNYVKGVSRFKVLPLIFPKANFRPDKALSLLSYPLEVFLRNSSEERPFFERLARELKAKLGSWKRFKPLRSLIEDMFKVAKKSFSLEKVHRYTLRSVKKFISLGVLLLGIVISLGFNSKESLQRLAEW